MTFINPTALPPGLDAALTAHPALPDLPASTVQLLGAQARWHAWRPGEEHVFHCFARRPAANASGCT